MRKCYKVTRVAATVDLDGQWDSGVWQGVEAAAIDNWMGDEPSHKPTAQVKAVYDDEAIYINFRVEDKYVRAVAKGYHGDVWEDSCVEFFFTPGDDIAQGYFNVETNCGGTMLFNRQTTRGVDVVKVADEDCDKVKMYHTLDEIVDPEIKADTTWQLQYRLPFEVIEKYAPTFVKPAPGKKWQANFYKCADETSHPHWLTWNIIKESQPNFHVPEFFGIFEFI